MDEPLPSGTWVVTVARVRLAGWAVRAMRPKVATERCIVAVG